MILDVSIRGSSLSFFLKKLFSIMYMYMLGGVCTSECWDPARPEALDPFEAGVTGSCELPNVDIGNQTYISARAVHALNH